MSFSVGIVGLPNVGKSTLFKALTRIPVNIAAYPFTTIHPNIGIVAIPDQRLKKIAELIKPEKITPTIIEFIDIAGLVKNSHKGEGLGNQFLAQIRNCDAILEVIRAFDNPKVEYIGEGRTVDGWRVEKDIEIIKTEFLMKDLEVLENALGRIENDIKLKDKKVLKKIETLKKIKEFIVQGKKISEIKLIDEEESEIKEYQFLTQKPVLYLLNTNGKSKWLAPLGEYLVMNLKEEEEISELSPEEKEELNIKSQVDNLILACYNILNLITFYTIAGEKETRAWTLKRGSKVIEAAGFVHSDFKERFIKAEVLNWQKLLKVGSWSIAREKGFIQIVGKDYLVQDGDVIEFKI